MYVNQIDELFDGILNKFYEYLKKNNAFKKLISDTNFVKFQHDILFYIKNFLDTISKKDILNIIKKDSFYDTVINIIKRYCAFYIYLGIAYHYTGSRDLFITNIIEAGKYQKDANIQISNFFNSDNNSKIITFYNDIKNFIGLLEYKTIDKIKILLGNNPIKYESTIKLFNDLGEDYIIEYFLIKDNFHNIMKTLIFRQIYLKEEKIGIMEMLSQQEKDNAEYKYIEIVISNEKKIVDFNIIQKFLSIEQLKLGLAEEIYTYLEENRDFKELIIKENQDFINYLFSNEIIIPITEDFLRYHKDNEKYNPESLVESANIKERDATNIKYIINKMNNVKNYYSPLLENNPKIKLETEKLFFKQLDPKMAVLFNENEELKIIQKLSQSENATDYDLLIDLENIRKYAYVNFKHLSKDGIKIRPQKTIQCIRYTNLQNKNKNPIELRITNNSIDANVVGIAWNPSKIPLDCFTVKDLINVNKVTKNDNGYNSFIKIMERTFNDPKNRKIYYWLFNNSKDKVKLESYINYSVDDHQKNIKIMIENIYYNYIRLIQNQFNNYIDKFDEISNSELNKILKGYTKKYFNFNLSPTIKNELIEKSLLEKIIELPIIDDDIDSIIPGVRDTLIELPIYKPDPKTKNIIILGQTEIDVSLELSKHNIPICQHHIKWKNILSLSKKTDDFNQAVFDFVKQYVRPNKRGEYICKSCNEIVQIQRYVAEGTYVEELDTFLTTSIVVTNKLEEIPKYAKYMRTIRNIEKNIEKFAYSLDIIAYIGNTPVIKLRRKTIIKDIIDLVLVHTEWLKTQPKNRIELFNQKYGINKELTNLFFFELKDDIFLTSSTDTDQYKIIKYNNIITYLIFLIITELNPGQILSFREDKRYNFFFFEKIGKSLFNDIYLRISQKEKVPINNIPLFAYVLYYLSGMTVVNRLWLYNDSNVDPKNKQLYIINMQKSVINTVVDLINTIMEANLDENKNFLYEIISSRLKQKLKYTFTDEQILKRIKSESMKNIKFDEGTNKVSFTTKKLELIKLDSEFNIMERLKPQCNLSITEIKRTQILKDKNNPDDLTNCNDGKFHIWQFKNNDLICNLCNKSYNELIKTTLTSSDNKNNNDFLDKIKILNLKKLTKKYCISGDIHDVDNNGVCLKCGVDINSFEPSSKDLKQLDINLDNKANELSIIQINKLKTYNEQLLKDRKDTKNILNKLLKRYAEHTDHKIENYIIDFIDRLIKILGPKIKINDKTIYLKDNIYIINHDYLGSEIKEPFTILESDNKIQLAQNHPSFNKDVLYYRDNANKVYVYYDSITYQYYGYSDDNKNIKKNKNNVSLKIELSLKDSLLYMGYENQYYNVFHLNKDYQYNLPKNLGEDTKDIVFKIIRNRMNNLKQIIIRTLSIIYNIKHNGSVISIYNNDEKSIINEFTKKLKNFNTKDENNHNTIFKHYKYILTQLPPNYKIPDNLNIELNDNYLNVNKINTLSNSDNKLLFYLIFNFNRLLDYNTQPALQSELAHLIIKIIKYSFNLYYKPYSNYNIRKFDFLLINETPYIDETLKISGHYQELLTQKEIDDPEQKERDYDAQEEFNSLDIDDYEENDDIDESMEALDGYED